MGFAAPGLSAVTTIQYQNTLSVQYQIYDGGKRQAQLNQARAGERKSRWDKAGTEMELIAAAIEAYLNVQRTQELLKSAREREQSIAAHLEIVRQRVIAELAQHSDQLKAEVQLETARQSVLVAENAVSQAIHALNLTMGLDPDCPTTTVASFSFPERNLQLEELQQKLSAANPTLLGLREQIRALQQSVTAARSAFRPSLSLTGTTFNAKKDFPPGDNGWTVAGSLDWTVLDGGQRQASVRTAQARLAEARASLKKARQQLDTALHRAFLNFTTARRRVQVTRKALDLAEEELRLSHLQVREGILTTTDHLDNQADYTTAQVNWIVATFDELTAVTALLQLSGQLNRPFTQLL